MGFLARLLRLGGPPPQARAASPPDQPAAPSVNPLDEALARLDRADSEDGGGSGRAEARARAAKERILDSFDDGERQKRLAETVRRMLREGRDASG